MNRVSEILHLVLLLSSPADDSKVDFLVDANESAVKMIHSLYMEIDAWRTLQEGKPVDNPGYMRTMWARDGLLERLQYKFDNGKTDSRGRPMNAGDLFLDGASERGMHNWDPEHPYALSDVDQGPLNAWIRPQSNLLPTPFPNPGGQFVLFDVQPEPAVYPRRTLRQFLEAAAAQVTVKRGNRPDTWIIHLASPKLSTAQGQLTFAEIELSENVNYLIRRTRFGFSDSPSSSKTYAVVEREILEYENAGSGVFIAKRGRHTLEGPALESTGPVVGEWEAKSVVVNSILPKGALEFAFPENAIVREFPAVNNRVTAWVSGANGEPVRQIRSSADIVSAPASTIGRPSSKWANFIGLAVLIVVAAALGRVIYRRLWNY